MACVAAAILNNKYCVFKPNYLNQFYLSDNFMECSKHKVISVKEGSYHFIVCSQFLI